MIKYRKITDISPVTDTISISKKTDKVPIRYRYRYVDIGDISTIFSIYRLTSNAYSRFKMVRPPYRTSKHVNFSNVDRHNHYGSTVGTLR